jgi:parallel beta-helix repeat protein
VTIASDPAARSANDLCSTTIVADVTLDQDLVCAGNGLTIGADGITVDLNGHTIAGSGSGVGIVVSGRSDVEIRRGRLTNFPVALRMNGSSGVEIERVEFVGNLEGIDLQAGSVGNSIKANVFRDSATRAIMLRQGATDNVISFNAFSRSRLGIQVFAGADNTITNNVITGSTVAGVRLGVLATRNTIRNNLIVSSHAVPGELIPAGAVEIVVMGTTSATGNDLLRNWLLQNDCGLKGPTAGNTVAGNVLWWNTAEVCG